MADLENKTRERPVDGRGRRSRTVRLSPSRKLMADLMHFSHGVPTVTAQREMRLAPLVDARRSSPERPSWTAIFTKAYGIVAKRRSDLRCTYLESPWARLYEHPSSVAAIAIERTLPDEETVFICQLARPESRALTVIDAFLQRCKDDPDEMFGAYRIASLPSFARRLLWRAVLRGSGKQRERFLGTFGVTSPASSGAGMLRVISPLSTTVHYGMLNGDGRLDVRLTFDHRVIDGAAAARALKELESVLLEQIISEVEAGGA